MSYYFTTTLNEDFDTAIQKITEELRKEGFGILTEIDVKQTFKEKLDIDFKKYRILGACNPKMAYQAISAESKIGTMLPCNVLIQETGDGRVEISAVDPVASMQAVQNNSLGEVATQVQEKLKKVIQNVK